MGAYMYNTEERAEGIKKQQGLYARKGVGGERLLVCKRERKPRKKEKEGISYIQWVCVRCYNGQCESMRRCQAMSKSMYVCGTRTMNVWSIVQGMGTQTRGEQDESESKAHTKAPRGVGPREIWSAPIHPPPYAPRPVPVRAPPHPQAQASDTVTTPSPSSSPRSQTPDSAPPTQTHTPPDSAPPTQTHTPPDSARSTDMPSCVHLRAHTSSDSARPTHSACRSRTQGCACPMWRCTRPGCAVRRRSTQVSRRPSAHARRCRRGAPTHPSRAGCPPSAGGQPICQMQVSIAIG
jgi:hypothetical protein